MWFTTHFLETEARARAAAYFGAFVYGSEIDLRVLQGTKIGRKSYKQKVLSKVADADQGFDVFTNFNYYKQALPEVLAMDVLSLNFRRT